MTERHQRPELGDGSARAWLSSGEIDEATPVDTEQGGGDLLVGVDVDETHGAAHAGPERRQTGDGQPKIGMGDRPEQGIHDALDRQDVDPPGSAPLDVGEPVDRAGDTGPLPTPTGLEVDGGARVQQGGLATPDAVRQSWRRIRQMEGAFQVPPLLGPRFRGDGATDRLVECQGVPGGDGG
ncbi:hypothetical protein [Skermanella stibiiresistens]|uniref:hypothetical protein n=1 Tax=Skermanella stibiiresistens TaxID=913326 RepID=UPI00055BA401|nr:hypothetical protein [Skermanella stibiiresistens]